MSVSSEGNHIEMPQDVATPDTEGTEKVYHEAALTGRWRFRGGKVRGRPWFWVYA